MKKLIFLFRKNPVVHFLLILLSVSSIWLLTSLAFAWNIINNLTPDKFDAQIQVFIIILIVSTIIYSLARKLFFNQLIKNEEIELRENKFKSLFNNLPIATYVFEWEGENYFLRDYNEKAYELTYGNISQFVGQKAHNIIRDEQILNGIDECRKNKNTITREGEYKFQYVDERKEVIFTYVFISPNIVMVHTEDITEKKETEKKLRSSEEIHRKFFESSPDCITVCSLDGKIIRTSEKAIEIFGFESVDEVLGKNVFEFIIPEERQRAAENFEKTLVDGRIRTVEYKAVTKNNKIIDVEISASIINDEEGNPISIIGVTRDKTESKKLEKQLVENEERYKSLFYKNEAPMLLIDPKTRMIKDANDAACKYYGYSYQKIKSLNVADINTLQVAELKRAAEKVLSRNKYTFNFKHKLASGVIRDVEVYSGKIIIENEELIFSIIFDITAKKETENKLIESEKKYREVLENMPLIGIMLDENGNINFCNKFLLELTGWNKNEVSGKNWFEIFVPEELQAEIKQIFTDLLEHNEFPSRHQNEIITKYNTKKVISWSNTVIRDNNGKIIGVTSIGEDITEKLATVEKIKLLSNAVEQSQSSIVITDKDGNIEYINPKFERLSGYTLQELIGENPGILKSGLTEHSIYDDLWTKLLLGKTWQGTFKNKKKNGEIFIESATISPILNEEGEIEHFVGLKEDITQLTKAQEELNNYKNYLEDLVEKRTKQLNDRNIFLKTFIDTIPNPVFVKDNAGNYIETNSAFCKMFSRTESEILGKNIRSIADNDISNLSEEKDSKLLQKYGTEIYETYVISNENKRIPVKVYKSSYGNLNEKPQGIAGMLIDISERKAVEEQLQKTLLRERELNEMKTNFISMASHEFRTPLTSISGSAELLELYGKKWPEEKYNKYIFSILESVSEMTDLLDDVLTLSRTDRGKLGFTPDFMNYNEFINTLINESTRQYKNSHRIISSNLLDKEMIWADAKLLKHILDNLISNAVKFSDAGSEISISAKNQNALIVIEVQDQGQGIPADEIEYIFSPFFRAKNSLETNGTGLGLSIVKRFVDLHKGTISVESRLGLGTKFIVKIPSEKS